MGVARMRSGCGYDEEWAWLGRGVGVAIMRSECG